MSELINEVPEKWRAQCRPYLQRAIEFEPKEPLIAYYLKTYVAFLCLNQRTKEDKEGTAFLMKLLDSLEAEKRDNPALKQRLEESDGRTVLTKFALMLFAKADDEERTGHSSMAIVRLFFASACLFEATAQFTDDKKMDNIAAEKCKYAKYIAAKMKKCLDSGVPYQTANKIEEPFADVPPQEGEEGGAMPPGLAGTNSGVFGSAPPSAYLPRPSAAPVAPVPDTPPPNYSSVASSRIPPSQPPQQPPLQSQPQQPPSLSPTPTPQRPQYAPPAHYAPPPSIPQQQTGKKASVDNMIDAQKFARQAVSALQFYDDETARKNLVEALQLLNR